MERYTPRGAHWIPNTNYSGDVTNGADGVIGLHLPLFFLMCVEARSKWYLFIIMMVITHPVACEEKFVSAWLGPSVQHFDFREFDKEGSRLNREEGVLLGVAGGVGYTAGPRAFQAMFSYHSDDVDHDGQTQSGRPIGTRTDESIFDGVLRFKKDIYTGELPIVNLFGGIGYRYWERDIRGVGNVSGLFETYDWLYLEAGMSASYKNNSASEWGADLGLMWPLDPEIEVEFHSGYDDAQLDLGSRLAVRAALSWERKFYKAINIQVRPYYEYWELGRSSKEDLTSDGVVVGSVVAPRSETRAFGVAITVEGRF